MSLANIRKIINIFLETPIEGKIRVFYTFLNKGQGKIDIIKFYRPYGPERKTYLYLADLEVKDSDGKLLEIIPQRDPCCGQGLLCIKRAIEAGEQKTILLSHILRLPVKYGGKLIRFTEFFYHVVGLPESSSYLYVSPPPNLSLKLVGVKPLQELIPSASSKEESSYSIIAEPPKSRGLYIRFEGKGTFEVRIKIEFPQSLRIWLYSILIFTCVSLLTKILNLLKIIPIGPSLPVMLSCIGALIATRVWLFYDETLTSRLNILYIALIILFIIICLFP